MNILNIMILVHPSKKEDFRALTGMSLASFLIIVNSYYEYYDFEYLEYYEYYDFGSSE